MNVWLVYKCTSDQYGTEALVGIFATEELAKEASNIPGYQTRVSQVKVHKDKESFCQKWMKV